MLRKIFAGSEMIKAVGFDMDDTLYDELDYYKSGMTAVAEIIAKDRNRRQQEVFEPLWRIFLGGNYHKTFDTALNELSIDYDQAYIEKLVDVLRNHRPQIFLPRESRKVLEELKGNYKLGLITDGFLPGQKYKVQALDIEKYFDCIIYTEELGRKLWKPAPESFEKMLRLLKMNPAESVFVGDNLKKDFIAPNKMKMTTVRITRPKGIHKSAAAEKTGEADYEISEISELPQLLEKIRNV